MGKKYYGSVYGAPYQRFRYLIKYLNNYYNDEKFKILIPNDKDGQHVLDSVRRGYEVDTYETNKIFVNGGTIDNFYLVGLKEKLRYFNMNEKVNIYEKNFYEQRVEKKYNFVYCYKSLHLFDNSHISMDKKIKKLLSSVKKDGFIYIYYHLSKNKLDYRTYPKHQYLRKGEMIKYFKKNWDIIFIKEDNNEAIDFPHPYNNINHTHLVGHIFARKKDNKNYDYFYNISSLNE